MNAPRSPAIHALVRSWIQQPGVPLACAVLGTVVMLSLAAPWTSVVPPHLPVDLEHLRSSAPSWRHPFGTDPLSRDVWSRLWHGGRYSLLVASAAGAWTVLLGGLLGVSGGFLPNWLDRGLQRAEDLLLSLPRLLLLLVAASAVGPLPAWSLALLLALTGWPRPARLIRSEVRWLRAHGCFEAARALGASRWSRVRRHVFPALLPTFGVLLTTQVASALLLETGLSFLGLGLAPPAPSWGTVLQELGDVFGPARWLLVLPGLVVTCAVAALFRLADTLPLALDASRRRHVS